jgi:high affinity Mn2+ porin
MRCALFRAGMRPARTAVAAAILLAFGLPACAAGQAGEAAPTPADFRKLLERVERLEQRNRELENRLDAARGAEARLKALEDAREQADKALASERLSEKEPELVTRLKAVEFQTLGMQRQARQIEALEGVTVGAGLVGVVQQVDRRGSADDGSAEGRGRSRVNYRGDVAVTLPGGSFGSAEGKLFAQFRFGQGAGVGLRPTYTSSPNTTAFETAAGPDDSFAILAQAWYQVDVPLPLDGFKPHARQRLEINVGKIDPFVFFDQNAVADDESTRFMNNALVHNPLLDSGGDVGVDAYGFTPGVRLAYVDEREGSQPWGVSVGVFGSGPGANFSGSLGKPFVIAQIEATRRFFVGLPGTYRLYAWRNGRAAGFDGSTQRHAGWGASIDQRLDDDWTVFARLGRQASGEVRFDRALTLGAETGGSRWGRSGDALGAGFAWLATSGAYRAATADGSLAGYAASGAERIVELYYRWRLNDRVQLSPDLQWIRRAAGDGGAASVKAAGLRVKVGF